MNKKIKKFIVRFLIFLFIILPILYMAIWAFVERWTYEEIIPELFTTRAWKSLFLNPKNLGIIIKSFILSSVSSIISILISYPCAKTLALEDFKFKNIIRVLLFIPLILPGTSFAIGLHLNFLKLGLANKIGGLIIVHVFLSIPYSIMIMEPVLSSIGKNYEDQAKLLGASNFQAFRWIGFPLMFPSFLATFAMNFIISFSQYFANFLIGGGVVTTYSMLIFPIISKKDRHESAVFSLVFLLICLSMFLICNIIAKRLRRSYEE